MAVEDHRRGHAGRPERADEGRRLPMAMWDRGDTTLARNASAHRAAPFGGGASLIDEDQPVDSISGCGSPHGRSATTSGRSCSLACEVFFERDVAAIEEPPERARHETFTVHFEEMVGDLGKRHVGVASTRAKISAAWLSIRAERRSPLAHPPHRRLYFATR